MLDYNHVDIDTRVISIHEICDKISNGEIIIPDYNIDNNPKQSELIESIVLGVHPTNILCKLTYENGNRTYSILDGKKRLITIKNFCDDKFQLSDMEFFPKINGCTYSKLPQPWQRTIMYANMRITVIRDIYKDPDVTNSLIRRLT